MSNSGASKQNQVATPPTVIIAEDTDLTKPTDEPANGVVAWNHGISPPRRPWSGDFASIPDRGAP
jgi:hypothetical protein